MTHLLALSIRTQYRHMPNHKKNSATGPRTPRTPQGSLAQKSISLVSTRPSNTGVRAITRMVETRKSVAACRVTSQLSLNQFQIIRDFLRRVGQRCFFLTWAHWSSIPLLQLAEGDSGVPHPSVLRVRVFLRCAFSEGYAQSSEASLRARRPSFRYLQLLSAETAAGEQRQ